MTQIQTDTIKKILELVPDRFEELVKKAITLAQTNHQGQIRYSGEEVFTHLLDVALKVAEVKLDTNSIIAALLHQSLSDTYNDSQEQGSNREYILKTFGEDVINLVENLEKINEATKTFNTVNHQTITKYLLSTSDDIRPALIKVCDALDNVQTITFVPKERMEDFCLKVFNIYAPIAEYLNVRPIQKELEEIAFKAYRPEEYERISRLLSRNKINDELKERYIEQLQLITDILGYKPKIFGRVKSIFSTYKKLKKYQDEGKGTHLSDVKDLLAFSILTQKEEDCFKIAQAIKQLTIENEKEFDDYITHPKPNGYSAIQITTQIPEISDLEIEIIILTHEMYYTNTYGPASHIAYKASMSRFSKATNEFEWVEQIHSAIDEHINLRETERSIPITGSIFKNQIFALTPKGMIVELQKGDTVLDFAYKIHTEIGNMAVSAKVNGVSARLSKKLESGDTVEIVTDPKKKKPSEKFLEYAHSISTIKKIERALSN